MTTHSTRSWARQSYVQERPQAAEPNAQEVLRELELLLREQTERRPQDPEGAEFAAWRAELIAIVDAIDQYAPQVQARNRSLVTFRRTASFGRP